MHVACSGCQMWCPEASVKLNSPTPPCLSHAFSRPLSMDASVFAAWSARKTPLGPKYYATQATSSDPWEKTDNFQRPLQVALSSAADSVDDGAQALLPPGMYVNCCDGFGCERWSVASRCIRREFRYLGCGVVGDKGVTERNTCDAEPQHQRAGVYPPGMFTRYRHNKTN